MSASWLRSTIKWGSVATGGGVGEGCLMATYVKSGGGGSCIGGLSICGRMRGILTDKTSKEGDLDLCASCLLLLVLVVVLLVVVVVVGGALPCCSFVW